MKTALVLLAFAASASAASLAGVSVDSGAFNIVNVNPTTGATTSSQKTLTTRPSGTLAYNNVRFDSNDMVWSLQTDSSTNGFLVSQDLRVNGRREECMLPTTSKPIVIFNDADAATVSGVAVSSTGTYGIYKFSINPNNQYCSASLLDTLSSVASVSATVSSQFGNAVFFATEESTGFSSTSGAQIRGYTIDATSAKVINTAVTLPGVFVTGMVADSATSVIVTGFDVGTSNTFASWKVDLATGTISSTPTTITSSTEELALGSAYINTGLFNLKFKRNTDLATSTVNLGFADFSSTNVIAEVTRSTAVTNGVFQLFELSDTVFQAINTDTTATSNTVVLTGNNFYSSSSSTSSLSKCRFTVGTLAAAEATAIGSTTGDGVTCIFTAPTTSTTEGTVVKVEFAADGVNYAGSISFNYGASSAASVQFTKTTYSLDDGAAYPSNRAPISAELFDASGNKLLFTSTALTGTISVSSSDASIQTVSGNSASASHGLLEFPNLLVNVYSTSASDNVANLQFQLSGASSASATAAATVRVLGATRGTLGALSLASTKFSYSVVNPTAGSALALGDRTLTTDNSIAFGLSAFDHDNIVLNTVELSSAGVPYLIGQAIRTSVSGQAGTGSCIIPTTTNVKDTPVKITYEKTNADGSVDFLGLVVLDGVTGSNYQIVRYNRIASSTTTTTCTKSVVDQLPQTMMAYAHAEFLNNGRVAIVEKDDIFSTSQTAFIHVWTMTSGTTAGSWQIRNKALGFSVVGITQAGDNDLAISGSVTSGGVVTSGVWRVDLSDDASAVLAPTTTKDKFTTDNEQAYFLYAGSADAPSDARLRTSVSQTSAGVRNTDVIQVFNANAVAADARAVAATSDFVALFNYNDASVTAVSPTTVSSSVTVSVTASNVISSTSLKCRFSADGVASFETAVSSTSATPTFPADGASYSCGSFPTTLLGDRAVYVQLSNDGGANYGAPACIAVGSGSCPAVLGVTATAAPSTAVPANPITISNLDTAKTKAIIGRNLPFSTANCAALLALGQAVAAEQGLALSGRNECIEIDAATVATGRLRSLATGTQVNLEFETAAAKQAFDAYLQTDAGKQWLSDNGLEASDVTTSVAAAEDEDDDLTDGEIAGIVIGSIAGVALIGALIAFALKGSSSSSSAAPAAAPAATYAARDVTAGSSSGSYDSTSGSYDSDYSSGSYDSEDYSGSYDGSTGSYSDYV